MTYYLQANRRRQPVAGARRSHGLRPRHSLTLAFLPLQSSLEAMLIDRMRTAPTLGQRITYYRAFLNIVSTENGRNVLEDDLERVGGKPGGCERSRITRRRRTHSQPVEFTPQAFRMPLKTKDRFDIVTRLAILGDPDAPSCSPISKRQKHPTTPSVTHTPHMRRLQPKKTEKSFGTTSPTTRTSPKAGSRRRWGHSIRPKHSDLTLPYLQRALGRAAKPETQPKDIFRQRLARRLHRRTKIARGARHRQQIPRR